MENNRVIIAGVDFTPSSRTALLQALRLGRLTGSPVRAVHVADFSWFDDLSTFGHFNGSRSQYEIAQRARRLSEECDALDAPLPKFDHDVITGHASHVLIRQVVEHNAKLLVLGVRSPITSVYGPGPIAKSCVRHSPCDVMLTREDHPGAFRRIVACTDFSDTSRRVIREAAKIAERDGASLRIVHIAAAPRLEYAAAGNPLGIWPSDPLNAMQSWNSYRAELPGRLSRFIEPVLNGNLKSVDMIAEVEDHDHHARGISAYARRNGADLIVIGSKGRSNLREFFLGTTAERVLSDLPSSALVIKPSEAGGH